MQPPADRYPRPSIIRVVVGLVVAGSLPGLLIGLLTLPGGAAINAFGFGAFLGIFYGIAPALVLGLPAVYLLRGVVRPTLKAAVIAGAIVASIPVALAAVGLSPAAFLLLLASIPLGAVGGAAFWFVALRNLRPIRADETPPPSERP